MKEKRKFTPIAMRCTKKQFETIKHKLKKYTNDIRKMDSFKKYPYLINELWGDKLIMNLSNDDHYITKMEIHETWNEKVFLEACGVETEETFQITREQIKYIYDHTHYDCKHIVKEWYNKAFEEDRVELPKDFTGWVKTNKEKDGDWLMYFGKGIQKYGFDFEGEWHEYDGKMTFEGDEVPATHQEVEEALRNEAVRLGIKNDVWIKDCNGVEIKVNGIFVVGIGTFHFGGATIMKNGQWATVLQTKTRQEAEKEIEKFGVNCKIID